MKQFDYIDAATVDEAAKAKANGADIIAGGTDLLGVLKKRILPEYPRRGREPQERTGPRRH